MPIRYRDAGVDIDAGESLVRRIAPLAAATRTSNVIADVGGFAGLCGLPSGMRDPVLVSGTDGVGTKLKLAFATGRHDTIGIDLVAMCVNDILCVGAKPLFFLDYFATGKLAVDVGEQVVGGIAKGCQEAGCALLGGETAELPGMYAEGEYDLAGFAVGVVERDAILRKERVGAGDVLVAVASSGLHSNGYSLARKVLLEKMELPLDDHDDRLGGTPADTMLVPTRIYARGAAALHEALGDALHGLCHVTGGGLTDNVPRALPEGVDAHVDLGTYERPALMRAIAAGGPVEEDEMRRTFNLGVGLVAVVASDAADAAIEALSGAGERAWRLGHVAAEAGPPKVRYVGDAENTVASG